MATVDHSEELEWERRLATPVAVAAILAGILMVQGLFVRAGLFEDREETEATPDFLLSLHDNAGAFLASAVVEAIGALLLGVVLYYLFRATRYRTPAVPEVFKWLAIIGPVLLAAWLIAYVLDTTDVADQFANGTPIRGDAGDERADDLLGDLSPVTLALQFAGRLAVAFLYVMIGVRAMRAGLLSRFMGILGVIVGVVLVVQVIPQAIVQLFWLGAIAALVLDRWPNGRGPAWETGEPDPWPAPPSRAAMRRGEEPEQADVAAPEDVPERPASRKRKRKR
jgi:hypothetical protein